MNEKESEIILKLSEIVDQILSGKQKFNFDIDEIDSIEDERIKGLADKIVSLGKQYRDSYSFIIDLAYGRLQTESPRMNFFANPFKQLHSELCHLTWQIKEIANGDYDQRVSFSGDFSEAFNKMIEALRERQSLAEINKENEYLFHSIFRTSPDGILMCELDNTIVNLSNAAKDMLLLTNEDINDRIRFIDLIKEEDKKIGKCFLMELLKETPTVFAEFRITKKDGSWFWSEQNACILHDRNGNPKGFIIIFRDITQRKTDEDKLLKIAEDLNESNKTKDKLFSIIAHDLKNPFNALLGFSNIIQKEAEKHNIEKISKYAKILNSSASKGFELLVNLLEWSRLQSNRISVLPEQLNLDDIIFHNISIGKTTALPKNIKLEYTNPGNYQVVSDKAIINTILRNLIGNAVKYTQQNGTIKISVGRKNKFYTISVKDSGMGIREDDINKLFRLDVAFSTPGTNNENGSGLGLVLCKEFVTKLGGEIHVESVYGEGTIFTFSLRNLL